MEIHCCDDAGRAAAKTGAALLRGIIDDQGTATIALAAGSSQLGMLEALVAEPDIAWDAITAYPLDDYVGLSGKHRASFERYLKERFVEQLPTPIKAFHAIQGDAEDPHTETVRMSRQLLQHEIDIAFVGIGENGHIAFNDPPADFDTEEPFIMVELNERCRQQQVNEGWFSTIEDVPHEAISMSVHQIMKSRHLVVTVPDSRKAEAVRAAVEGEITSRVPASILQKHEACQLFLDHDSASLLEQFQVPES